MSGTLSNNGLMQEIRPNNNLLSALRREDFDCLAPHLEFTARSSADLLYRPGDNVETVYFPCGPSLVSYLVPNDEGQEVETVLVGREGAVGGIVSLGHLPAYCQILVKYPGEFVKLKVSCLEAAKARSPSIRFMFARYADCLLAQIFQSTACNAIHSIERRTAKWILSAMDRTGDHRVPLTQEELAGMLGVGRSYTSRVLKSFRMEGILGTQRGALLVLDLDALRARSCSCNESVKSHFDIVLKGVYPTELEDQSAVPAAATGGS